jgi:hypothetical protein
LNSIQEWGIGNWLPGFCLYGTVVNVEWRMRMMGAYKEGMVRGDEGVDEVLGSSLLACQPKYR